MASTHVETVRAAHQAFNRRDFTAVTNLLTEDCTYEDRARGVTLRGRDGFRQFMQGWVDAFSNATISDPVYTDGGTTVVAEFVGRGTNDGPLDPAHPATGRAMSLPFCEITRFNAQGQIISGGIYYDQMTMLAQLGIVQAVGVAAS